MATENKRAVPLDVEWAESGFDPVVIEMARQTAFIKRLLGVEDNQDNLGGRAIVEDVCGK